MSWILTHSGTAFDPINPNPAAININDIAHALSHICRFNGHTREFYSVAQHSCIVSNIVPTELALAALLHDASEAFICDVASPVKPHLEGYVCIEHRIMLAVAHAFDIDPALFRHPEIKRADLVALATEKRDLMPAHHAPWPCLAGLSPLPNTIEAASSHRAKEMFLTTFEHLTGERAAA
ncbi:phosphohydrolase [Chromobacterium haemolyticum]|uniref:Phosphohydrolase n=1 Tax=Chromobacterium fluminis TaxID=3044269 RepID=A0ABX0LGN3_9NEIS|nr:phosphohydrolase [Chromobacterium haemolyticum]NHR08383.1 phosphohydrolase [Chromobacterium haemolyticum]